MRLLTDGDDADGLRASYTTLRDTFHHLALQALPGLVPVAQFASERSLIGHCWRQWLD
jgi:glutamate-ammonia-ligase adenylyltransferase